MQAIKQANGMIDNSTIKLNSTVKRLLVCLVISLLLCPSTCGQTKRALLVGISDYSNYSKSTIGKWSNIHGANDVQLIATSLKRQHFKITTITNKNATAQRIRKELKSLSNSCRKGDVVYIHFSCHGQPFEDRNGDEEDGWDESIIPYDAPKVFIKGKYEGTNHILDDELHGYFQRIRQSIGATGFLCVVIDACHAGGSQRGEDFDEDEPICRGTKDAFSPNGKTYRPRVNTNGHFTIPSGDKLGNIVILEACRSYQSNYEIKQDGKYYGPLSYYINKALSTHNLTPNMKWVQEVKRLMDSDRRLTKQNMVYETSLK